MDYPQLLAERGSDRLAAFTLLREMVEEVVDLALGGPTTAAAAERAPMRVPHGAPHGRAAVAGTR